MTAHITSRHEARTDLNHLRLGSTYLATTRRGNSIGVYLGMETPHGDRAILLRHAAGTDSIDIDDITSIRAAA